LINRDRKELSYLSLSRLMNVYLLQSFPIISINIYGKSLLKGRVCFVHKVQLSQAQTFQEIYSTMLEEISTVYRSFHVQQVNSQWCAVEGWLHMALIVWQGQEACTLIFKSIKLEQKVVPEKCRTHKSMIKATRARGILQKEIKCYKIS
jgi:hypothetical protein